MPVFLVSDQHLSQRIQTVPLPDLSRIPVVERERAQRADGKYQRYELTSSGISAMSVPGSEHGIYVATGLEHDLSGHPNYEPEMHRAMTAKRFRKLAQAAREVTQEARRYGSARAVVGVIG